jgi:hypothetical protein
VANVTRNGFDRDVLEERRFWAAILLFIALELTMIFAFGGSYYGDPDPAYVDPDGVSSVVVWVLSGLGYFVLGAVSGRWETWPVLFIPLVISFAVGIPADAIYGSSGEPIPLFAVLLFAMIGFLPLWVLGVLAGSRLAPASGR